MDSFGLSRVPPALTPSPQRFARAALLSRPISIALGRRAIDFTYARMSSGSLITAVEPLRGPRSVQGRAMQQQEDAWHYQQHERELHNQARDDRDGKGLLH